MRNYFPAIKTEHGDLVPLAAASALMVIAQDAAMTAMAIEHLEGVPFNEANALVIVRVADGAIVRKYNKQIKGWESVPI